MFNQAGVVNVIYEQLKCTGVYSTMRVVAFLVALQGRLGVVLGLVWLLLLRPLASQATRVGYRDIWGAWTHNVRLRTGFGLRALYFHQRGG